MEIKDVVKIRDDLQKTLAQLNRLLADYDNFGGMHKNDLDVCIDDLCIPARPWNILKSCGIETIRDLLLFCEQRRLTSEPNFGPKSLRQLLVALKSKFGIDFEGKVR